MEETLESKIELGILVKFHRKQRGLTQEELGRMAGLSHSYITLIERGLRKNVGIDNIKKMADIFKLDEQMRQIFYQSAGYYAPVINQPNKKSKYSFLFDELSRDMESLSPEEFGSRLYKAAELIVDIAPKNEEERKEYKERLRIFKFFISPIKYKDGFALLRKLAKTLN